MYQLLWETGIVLWPENHTPVARTVIDGTFITEKKLWVRDGMSHRVDPCQHLTVHSWKLSNMASLSRLSLHGFTFFVMGLEALMIITMSISFGNTEWKWWLQCCTNLNWFWVHIVWVASDFSPTPHTEMLQKQQHTLTLNLDTNCKNRRTRTCASCTYLPSTNWYGQLMDP